MTVAYLSCHMDKALKDQIEYLLCIKILNTRAVSGGDISQAYLIETESERFFCKMHQSKNAFEMFQAEKEGLKTLKVSNTIGVPQVLTCNRTDNGALFILEYIVRKTPNTVDFKNLGFQLAALHKMGDAKTFGFEHDNFIGSLPQSNNKHDNWVDFYVQERLQPQLIMALDSGRLNTAEVPAESKLLGRCNSLFPNIKPSLLHGDLWSGNFLIATNGQPYLIDPAVYAGHHEVDLAMSRLFGGFGDRFYSAYHEIIPKETGERERCEIYQLYYLLVHLNLFGTSYKSSVNHILQRYFH